MIALPVSLLSLFPLSFPFFFPHFTLPSPLTPLSPPLSLPSPLPSHFPLSLHTSLSPPSLPLLTFSISLSPLLAHSLLSLSSLQYKDEMPKLPKSSFQYYITKKVAKIKEKNPGVNGWTVRSQLTEKWAQMSPEDKVS